MEPGGEEAPAIISSNASRLATSICKRKSRADPEFFCEGGGGGGGGAKGRGVYYHGLGVATKYCA